MTDIQSFAFDLKIMVILILVCKIYVMSIQIDYHFAKVKLVWRDNVFKKIKI